MRRRASMVSIFLFVAGCASAVDELGSSRYRRVSSSDGPICVDKKLRYRMLQIAGILGTHLGGSQQGLLLSLPMGRGVGKADELGLFLRPASGDSLSPSHPVDASAAILGSEVPEISVLPRETSPPRNQVVVGPTVSKLIGPFVAECDHMPGMQLCSRRFEFEGLEGSYAFKREDLSRWREMEVVLADTLISKNVLMCSNLRRS